MRGCGRPLTRLDRRFACDVGHSFDVARTGYLNLLQPDDRKSLEAGDAKGAVEARARLLDAGAGRALIGVLRRIVQARPLLPGTVVLDLGSGSGHHLAALAETSPIVGVGIDLSTAAASLAARRYPHLTWLVANADRRLPILDRSAGVVLSVHGRRHPLECARVLSPRGHLVVCVPAPDDLVELREAVLGGRVERDRTAAVIAEHDALFTLTERLEARHRQRFEPAALRDLLAGTYRGERFSQDSRLQTLAALDVTLASDVLVFAPR